MSKEEVWEKLSELVDELQSIYDEAVESADIHFRYEDEDVGLDILRARELIKKAMTYVEG